MAQLVLAAGGAVIGGFIGGPTGAQIGWALGSALGSSFAPAQESSGPRLGDLTVSGSSYGSVSPYVLGSPRVAGQIIWASAKREIPTTQSSGSKGGGPKQSYTSYTYEVDILFKLSDNQIAGISRVWSSGKLIWSAVNGVESAIASGGTSNWSRITPYTGALAQMPDPTYEASVGAGNAPAYRGCGTVFIQSLQLGSSGALPNLTFEIAASVTGSVVALQHFETPGYVTFQGNYPPNANFTVTTYSGVTAAVGPSWTLEAWGASGNFTSPPTSEQYNSLSRVSAPGVLGDMSYLSCQTSGKASVEYSTAWAKIDSSFAVDANEDFSIEFVHDPKDPGYNQGVFATSAARTCVQFGASGVAGSWAIVSAPAASSRGYQFAFGGGGGLGGGAVPSTTRRVRVGVSRKGNTLTMCYDGVVVATSTNATYGPVAWSTSGYINVGSDGPGPYAYTQNCPGVYDELLIARGIALFGANYTPAVYQYGDARTVTIGSLTPISVQSAVSAICLQAGLSVDQFDVSDLAGISTPVRALAISQVSSARTVLDTLGTCYFFSAVLSDKIYFRRRGAASAAVIGFDDLGYQDSGSAADPLPLTKSNDLEIAAQIALSYQNIDNDHQPDTQYSDRLLTGQQSTSVTQVPLGFYANEAKIIADAVLADMAASALTTRISLSLAYARLEPADVVTVGDAAGSTYNLRLLKRSEQNGILSFEAVSEDASVFSQSGATSAGAQAQFTVYAAPSSSLLLLDIPLLQDSDNAPGHYAAVKGNTPGWINAGLYQSSADNGYTLVNTVVSPAVFGVSTTALGAYAGDAVWDESSTVTVDVGAGQLSSSTRESILQSLYTNAALIGGELVQFRTATLVRSGVYLLSGFLRGRKGTGWAATSHVSGEVFCLMGGGMALVPMQSVDLGKTWYYKAASAGAKLSATTTKSIVPQGVLLKPYAPVDLRVNRASANTVLTWKRRSRLSARLVGPLGINVPLGETSESYDVEIYTSSAFTTLKRTFSGLATATVTYTSALQVTDFGAAQSDFYVKVYQNSATIGRGYALTVAAVKPTEQDTAWTSKSGGTFSNLDRTFTASGINQWARANAFSSGKRYFEVVRTGPLMLSLCSAASNLNSASLATIGGVHVLWRTDSTQAWVNGSALTGVVCANNDVLGIAIDLDAGRAWLMRNGAAVSGSPTAGTGGFTGLTGALGPAASSGDGACTAANFVSSYGNVKYPIAGFTGFLV